MTPRRRNTRCRRPVRKTRYRSAGRDRTNSCLPVDPREVIPKIAAARGETLTALSLMLSRDPGYLARFVREGRPVAMTVRDHRLLADHFGVTERGLGIRDLWGDRARGW